jgi:hypothetical protein
MDIGLTVISTDASVLPDGCAPVRIALILNNISMCKG